MGLNLAAGGHLTHGSPVNMSGKWFKPVPYGVRRDDHRIDMDEVERLAKEHKPKLIIAGGSAYPRTWLKSSRKCVCGLLAPTYTEGGIGCGVLHGVASPCVAIEGDVHLTSVGRQLAYYHRRARHLYGRQIVGSRRAANVQPIEAVRRIAARFRRPGEGNVVAVKLRPLEGPVMTAFTMLAAV